MEDILMQVGTHYRSWKEDNDKRRTRTNGWNAVTDAYWGKLPGDWPYTSKVVDPVIRTSLTEKNARLLNSKLRGRLVPREGGDVLKARINNALLDFQWDNANYGGSMLSKYAQKDMDTRLYASKFALVPWMHVEDKDGKVIFDGNEMIPLDIRDCGIDPTSTHIRNAKWFQHRKWAKIEDLEDTSDSPSGKKYPGLAALKKKIGEGMVSQNRRDSEYDDRVRQNKGLTDRTGEDKAFPVIEIVTEYRKDRWITFAPKYNVILRDIDNPYDHGQIPITQLRYYPLGDDPIGESEVEPVLPLWKAICATLCGYLDNMNIHMRPPLKILPGATIETIVWGAEAQWQMSKPDDVTEMQSGGEAMRYFQTTYSALKSAFNTAMGDLSQGVGGVDPFNPDNKTATEIKQTAKQQNARDQSNQMYLSEDISDMMMMWVSNNKQFLFLDPKKHDYILRVIGTDLFEYFKRAGLDEMVVEPEAMEMIGEIIQNTDGNLSDQDIQQLYETAKTPKFPVYDNPKEKDPSKLKVKPKMKMNDMGDAGELSISQDDLDGTYDYIADVVSMQTGASDQLLKAQQNALSMLTTNPTVLQLLTQQGVQPQIKDLMISILDQAGLKDAERYFQSTPQQPQIGASGGNGPVGAFPLPPVPEQMATPSAQGLPAGMA
jgi:hypothetical protein